MYNRYRKYRTYRNFGYSRAYSRRMSRRRKW